MSALNPINEYDGLGLKWVKLQRWLRLAVDNAEITYTLGGLLTDIREGDGDGLRWAKLGAWMELLADNISGGGGGGPAAAGTLTGDTLAPNVVNSSLTSFGVGVAFLKNATVTLTDAQIKALPTTGIQIVAAPGVGKIIVPVQSIVILNTTAGAYTGATDASLSLLLGVEMVTPPMTTQGALEVAGLVSGMFNIPYVTPGNGNFEGDNRTILQGGNGGLANTALVIKDDYMGASNYTGGNAANTMKVSVWWVEATV